MGSRRQGENKTLAKLNDYDGFVEKFEAKKTTDDCYTPQWCYDVVREWVNDNVQPLEGVRIVRPFWPGADYQKFDYQPGDVVLDNPPFSIVTQVCDWLHAHGIKFFLFAPALTIGGIVKDNYCAVITKTEVTYENGARVSTAFVTNMLPERIYVSSELSEMLSEGEKLAKREKSKPLPRYELPDGVVTGARLQKLATAGVTLRIMPEEAKFVRALDSQRAQKKALYGSGWLLSREAAAREAAAREAAAREAAAREVCHWPLSEREIQIMRELGS